MVTKVLYRTQEIFRKSPEKHNGEMVEDKLA